MIDMSIDKCRICGIKTSYVYTGNDAQGDIFEFDLCIDCEDYINQLITKSERMASLTRWTWDDKR